jgi:hypothetical protein
MSMFDLTQLSDDALRAALFDALVERLDAEADNDPSVVVVNRMPTVVTVSRPGNLLTLSQGLGLWLLRGALKWKDDRERLRTFSVGRASLQSKLAITPDGIAGTPDEILDWIVALLFARIEGESRPAVTELPLTSRTEREGRPAPPDVPRATPVVVLEEDSPRPEMEDSPSEPDVAAPRPALVRETEKPPIRETEKSTPTLRTYQLLFEIAQRELKLAKALPIDRSSYFLIGAGVSVALAAEAFFNDLGSRVISSWGQLQRLDPREKAEVLNIELFKDPVDWSVSPFQSVAAALGFRRALAHAHAETLAVDQPRSANRRGNEVPRTRRTAWQDHCDVETIQRWITDVHLMIEHFSRGEDPSRAAPPGMAEPPSASSSSEAGTRKTRASDSIG